ncbi:MAG: sulfotransferase [Erythrobacter sp.]|nr:sulfotransferase [Erythrobacter sp.]
MTSFAGRYVFVAGLHRTGTSLVARMIAQHEAVRAIAGSPAPEDEGCYLQGAIPHTARHGIPGRYATEPAQHHVEGDRFDTLETKMRIEADWDRCFAPGGTWRVEKSPVNLTRMRLYQQLFPMAQFVIVLRHPAVMAAALAKWIDEDAATLIDYALDAYDLAFRDLEYLHAAMVLRYEDLVTNGAAAPFWRFLSLDDAPNSCKLRDGNSEYLDLARMSADQIERASRYGYGQGGAIGGFEPVVRHPLRAVREATRAALAG